MGSEGRSSEGPLRLALALGVEVPFTEMEPVGASRQEAKHPGRDPRTGAGKGSGGLVFQVFLRRGGGAEGGGWESPTSRPRRCGVKGVHTPGWYRLGGERCRGEVGRGHPN